MSKRSQDKQLALRLRRPVKNYLKTKGIVFQKSTPGLNELATELKKLHPEIGRSVPKRRTLVIFSELYPQWITFVPKSSVNPTQSLPRAPRKKSKVEFDAFYVSKPWRVLRYKALKHHGAKCQCCGGTAASTGKPLHVDHVKPRYKFPELELELSNLQVLCEDCNMGKGGWDQTDWRDPLIEEFKAVVGSP